MRRGLGKTVSVAIITLGLGICLTRQSAFAAVVTQLCFAIDGSSSIIDADFMLEKGGIAAAVEDPTIVPQDGSVEISVVQFPGVLAVQPVIINNATTAANTAAAIRNIAKTNGGTPMDQGINNCKTAIVMSPEFATAFRQVINLATDGFPASAPNALAARDNAIMAGIDLLPAEAVGTGADTNFLSMLVFPQPAEVLTPPQVPSDPKNIGFVLKVSSFTDFAQAIKAKVQAVVNPKCGDGNLDPGEQCDDRNTANSDGCSSTCQSEDPCITFCASPQALHVNTLNRPLIGTGRSETLCGDDRDNIIEGRSGNDVLCGFGGKDMLRGQNGDDEIHGGPGNDTLIGGPGNDTLFGEAGNDTLVGGTADETITDPTGQDTLMGGPDNDTLFGSEARDTLFGDEGDDLLDGGGAGGDRCDGGSQITRDRATSTCEIITNVP